MIWTCLLLLVLMVIGIAVYLQASMTITTSWSISESGEGVGIAASASVTVTGDGVISVTAPTGPANTEIDVAWDADTIQGLIIVSTVDCTIYTNNASGGSPNDTVVLKANNPLHWHKNGGIPFPFVGTTGNVVNKIYVTNVAAAAGTLKIRGVADLTP